jgi:type II secretory pathway pseudopilin PulG
MTKRREFNIKSGKGFSLIETIIYIALFSIIMTGAFVTAYQLLDGSGRLNAKAITAEEGNFAVKKIEWAMTNLDPSSTPTVGGSGCFQTLSIQRTSDPTNVAISLETVGGKNYLKISQNGGQMATTTTENVSVSCLQFETISGTPTGITATTTIDGLEFVVTKYIRK